MANIFLLTIGVPLQKQATLSPLIIIKGGKSGHHSAVQRVTPVTQAYAWGGQVQQKECTVRL